MEEKAATRLEQKIPDISHNQWAYDSREVDNDTGYAFSTELTVHEQSINQADKIQQQTLTQTEKSFEAGNASKFELDSQRTTAQITKLSVEQAKYAVLEALMNYDFAVAGLADAGSM